MERKKERRLSAQQAQFVEAYLQSRDTAAAAEKAGYSAPYKLSGAKVFRNRTVAIEIERRLERIQKQTDAQYAQGQLKTVTRGDVMQRLWDLASMGPLGESQNISAQVRACDALADILGMKVALTADVTEQFAGKSDEQKVFFAMHGFWPGEEPTTVQ